LLRRHHRLLHRLLGLVHWLDGNVTAAAIAAIATGSSTCWRPAITLNGECCRNIAGNIVWHSIDSTKSWWHTDTLTDTVPINCAQNLVAGLIVNVSLLSELS